MSKESPKTIEMPASTPSPIVLAFGLTLLSAGLVTSSSISALGAIISIAGAVGWFRDVLPHETHESVPVSEAMPVVAKARREVARIGVEGELHRARHFDRLW